MFSEIQEIINRSILFFGLYSLSVWLYKSFRSPVQILYSKWLTTPKSLKERYGDWAAITGSSDGIGKSIARELARQGINIVLLARNQAKLERVAKEIETEFNVKTKIIVADFSKGAPIYAHIELELGKLPIGILINNVGQPTSINGEFANVDGHEIWHVLNTNMGSMAYLSHLFLNRMRVAGIKGLICNVSSCTGSNPCPYLAIYSATKAFASSLTVSLMHEARPHGIKVQLLAPWFVNTNLIAPVKLTRNIAFVPQADVYARSAVGLLGLADETTGFFWHAVQDLTFKMLPWRFRVHFWRIYFKHKFN